MRRRCGPPRILSSDWRCPKQVAKELVHLSGCLKVFVEGLTSPHHHLGHPLQVQEEETGGRGSWGTLLSWSSERTPVPTVLEWEKEGE